MMAANRPTEALHELRVAVSLEPDSASAHHDLATALLNTRDFEEAAAEFRQTVRLQPTAPNHYDLAACLMYLGRDGEALAELEIALRLEPDEKLYRARKEELLKTMKPERR